MSALRTEKTSKTHEPRSGCIWLKRLRHRCVHRTARTLLGVAVLLGVYGLLGPAVVHAANYSFSPASGSFENGKNFTVRVMIDAGSDGVNTGDGTVTFDTAKLTAVSVAKDGSPFNLWVTEPTIAAGAGTITFAGGGTTAISGSKAAFTITFRGKAEGAAEVKMSKGSLLKGAGQNALTGELPAASYTITAAAAKPPTPAAEPEPATPVRAVNIPVPDPPVLKSSTHPEQGTWYQERNIKLTWDLPYGVTGLKLAFDQEEQSEPTTLHEPPIAEWTKGAVEDGIWYFHASYKNRGGWSSSTHYKIMIDATPPRPFTATAAGGDLTAQVRFEAEDELSGIAFYRVGVDNERSRDVQPSELVSGGYTMTNLTPGERTITITAVDRAGNETTTEVPVVVTGTAPVAQTTDNVKTSGFGAIYWVSLLFMAALAIVITMLVQERRRHHEERDLIKREAMEAGDKLINVFGVLRDEMEERILELAHKPNMTDSERQILEGLKDAIDISEELIDKEIEDVRKLLK